VTYKEIAMDTWTTPSVWRDLQKKYPAMAIDDRTTKINTKSTVIEPSKDMVNSPSHYTAGDGSIECIDAIEASMTVEAFRGYCKGAALKYLWRYERKSKSLEDLKKAQWYQNRLISTYD